MSRSTEISPYVRGRLQEYLDGILNRDGNYLKLSAELPRVEHALPAVHLFLEVMAKEGQSLMRIDLHDIRAGDTMTIMDLARSFTVELGS